MVTKQLFDKLGMPVYSEHAIAAYFAYLPHIFRAYFKLDRSAYFGKISAINWHACMTSGRKYGIAALETNYMLLDLL